MKTAYLQKIKGIWRVRVVVPPHLVPILGKTALLRSTGTGDEVKAQEIAAPFTAKFLARIKDAECQLQGEPKTWWMEYNYSPWNSFGSSRLRRGQPPPNMIPVIRDGQIAGYRLPGYPMPVAQIGEVTNQVVQFDSLIALWASHRPSTTQKARQAMAGKMNRLAAFLGHSDAARVKPDNLAAYLRTLLASGLKPNTVDDHVAYLRRIFTLAKEAEWITTNPAERLRRA